MKHRSVLLFVLSIFSAVIPLNSFTLFAQTDNTALADKIDNYLSQLDSSYFSGAVLVANADGIVLQTGYGSTDDDGTPITADTVFDIGSISKQFTAAAVLTLVANGKLTVDDPLSQYFPDVPADKANITIHQLLTHSAGFSDHVTGEQGDLEPLDKAAALKRIFEQELLFTPADGYEYSNSGYTLLAAIVEEVAGQPFTPYLQAHLFAPAGMEHTGFYNDPRWANESVAQGYANGENNGSPATWGGPYWTVMGNGGVMSTVGDMYLWWQSLQTDVILPSAYREQLFTPHVAENNTEFYGYGWSIRDGQYGHLITHNGGGIGGNSDVAAYTDRDTLIIILTNRIVYKETFGIPCHVELPATETREQLTVNMFSDDFSGLPRPTIKVC